VPSAPHIIRERLMRPPNAVPDHGICMRNGRPVRLGPAHTNVVSFAPAKVNEPTELWPGELAADFWLPWVTYLEVPQKPKVCTVPEIIKAFAMVFDVRPDELKGPRRTFPLTLYRQAAYAITRRLTTKSFPQIGWHFGGRDHSTVMYACRKMRPHIDAVEAELGSDAASPIEWAMSMQRRLQGVKFGLHSPEVSQ
jgi:hypothetical protein